MRSTHLYQEVHYTLYLYLSNAVMSLVARGASSCDKFCFSSYHREISEDHDLLEYVWDITAVEQKPRVVTVPV